MDSKSSDLFRRIKEGIGQVKEEIGTIHHHNHHLQHEPEFKSKPPISESDMRFLAQSINVLNRVCFCEYEVRNIFKRTKREVTSIVEFHGPHEHDGIFERVLQEEMEILARTIRLDRNGKFILVNCEYGYEDESFVSRIGRWFERMCTPTSYKD